ncbi:MAG: ABC transporter permease [Parvibaculaceae bacterium]
MSAMATHTSAVRRGRLATSLLLVLPLALVIGLAFDLPLLMTAVWSITDFKTGSLTPEYYQAFFGRPVYLSVVWRTLEIAFAVSCCCALVGYPLSYWMTTLSPRGQKLSLIIIVMSFWVSVLVRTYAWIVILGNAGLVNRALQQLGLADRPVQFLYGELGVCIGMVNVLLPFLLLPLYAAMLQIDPRLRQIALTMGATSVQYFWRVFFPLTLPALAATFILVFILSLGFYITPAILGGGKVPMIANMLDMLINQFPHWSLAAAISCVMLVLTLGLFAVYQSLRARVAA